MVTMRGRSANVAKIVFQGLNQQRTVDHMGEITVLKVVEELVDIF